MDELIKTFHLDWKLIIAQVINLGVVVWVIYKFFWGKIKTVLDDRQNQVILSNERAQEIENNLSKIKIEREEVKKETQAEAQSVLQEAQRGALAERERILQKTKDEAAQIIQQAKAHLASEKEAMKEELLTEMKELVVATTSKVLQQVMNKELEEKVVKAAAKELKHHD